MFNYDLKRLMLKRKNIFQTIKKLQTLPPEGLGEAVIYE